MFSLYDYQLFRLLMYDMTYQHCRSYEDENGCFQCFFESKFVLYVYFSFSVFICMKSHVTKPGPVWFYSILACLSFMHHKLLLKGCGNFYLRNRGAYSWKSSRALNMLTNPNGGSWFHNNVCSRYQKHLLRIMFTYQSRIFAFGR